jgi:hypothetical protein
VKRLFRLHDKGKQKAFEIEIDDRVALTTRRVNAIVTPAEEAPTRRFDY